MERMAIYNQSDITRMYYVVKSDWVETYDDPDAVYDTEYIIENNAYDYKAVNKRIKKIISGWKLHSLSSTEKDEDDNQKAILYTRASALVLLFLLVEPSKKGTTISKIISQKANEISLDEKKKLIGRLDSFLRNNNWNRGGKWYKALDNLCSSSQDEPLSDEEITKVIYNFSQVVYFQIAFCDLKESIHKHIDYKLSQMFYDQDFSKAFLGEEEFFAPGIFSSLSLGELLDVVEHLKLKYTKTANELFDCWILNFDRMYDDENYSIHEIIEKIY